MRVYAVMLEVTFMHGGVERFPLATFETEADAMRRGAEENSFILSLSTVSVSVPGSPQTVALFAVLARLHIKSLRVLQGEIQLASPLLAPAPSKLILSS
jgi:hypothetical protein